jgi:L-fuconolactonase
VAGFDKRLDGLDEVILDPERPIIDAHFHLFHRPALRYLFDDYLKDATSGHRVVASVYVETMAFARGEGPEVMRPIGEVEFANGAAAMSASGLYGACRVAKGIVGHADLRFGDAIAVLLDRALEAAPERFRGVRQVTMEHANDAAFRYFQRPPVGIMRSPGFRPAFRHLEQRGLSFDAAVYHSQLSELGDLAAAFPDTAIVLNNTGFAMAAEMAVKERLEVFRDWRNALRELARQPNVLCKLGGLGMPQWGFGFEERTDPIGYLELADAWRPYIETAIDAFGVDRCMMQSNFPPDGRSCGFVPLWNAMKHITADFSQAEKQQLFHDTAARAYRLDV